MSRDALTKLILTCWMQCDSMAPVQSEPTPTQQSEPTPTQAAAQEIVKRRGKGLLLLLEGFDELPTDLRTQHSLFMRIITGLELPEATVMITSRPSAKFLDVSDNNLTPKAIQLLFSGLQHNTTLEQLVLNFNPLGSGGAVPLLQSGVAHSLGHPSLCSTGIGEDDCRALGSLLSAATRLKLLDISNNSLSPMASLTVTGVEDCRALGELLSSSQNLQFLEISAGSGLPPEAVELIITGLQFNTALEILDVSDSHFSLQNCISLASVLRNHHLLSSLCLCRCSIDADGASELAKALARNNTLRTLELWQNPIGIRGATAVAEMLPHNQSLEDLKLNHESIGPEGTRKLIESQCHPVATNATSKV